MSYYIYKICCDDCPEFVYVGSTKSFRQRKNQHKKGCNNENDKSYNRKLYVNIRENGGWDKWRMVVLEDLGEVSFTQARIKEEEHRVKLNANLNSQKCYLTEEERKEERKEYKKNNKEKHKENFKEYYENNKEKIKEHRCQPFTCECGRTFTIRCKARHEKTLIHKELIEEKNNI